jgi:hypothetical protein
MIKYIFKLFIIQLLTLFLHTGSMAQSQSTRKDFDSTSMSIISTVYRKSEKIILPQRILAELKEYSISKNIPLSHVIKNSAALKMLFNENLTRNEKKVYLEWAIDNFTHDNQCLPATYFKEALAALK